MAIENRYDQSVDVHRLAEDTDNVETFAAHLSGVACMIQPLDAGYTEDVEGNFGKDFVMFCANVDIKEGDKIIDGSTEYRVVGVEVFDRGNAQHTELTIRTFNP